MSDTKTFEVDTVYALKNSPFGEIYEGWEIMDALAPGGFLDGENLSFDDFFVFTDHSELQKYALLYRSETLNDRFNQ